MHRHGEAAEAAALALSAPVSNPRHPRRPADPRRVKALAGPRVFAGRAGFLQKAQVRDLIEGWFARDWASKPTTEAIADVSR